MKSIILTLFLTCMLYAGVSCQEKATAPLIGMYIHQGWSYNHPYATRTWTVDDWRNYLGGISQLGYNSILIWPLLETMPNPITASDEAHITKTRKVIEIAQKDFGMKVFIVFCPNIGPNNAVSSKYSYEDRPLYGADEYIDPSDPVELGKLMEWRETLFEPLKQVNGIFVIDSDPGGYANSTNLEFAYLLTAHRRMLDRLRPGIEIYYWAWTGWESYGRFHATGNFKMGEQAEINDALGLIDKQHIEPWGVATHWSGYGAGVLPELQDRVLAYNYGAIEADPAFPFTGYGQGAYDAGSLKGARGVFGNALTHGVQLPNTLAFAKGALGQRLERSDYVAFAEQLIIGGGLQIVGGWESLQGTDPLKMRTAAHELSILKRKELRAGKYKGLLFGDPQRFLDDLISQLYMAADLYLLKQELNAGTGKQNKRVVSAFSSFIASIDNWKNRHGYNSYWYWPAMTEVLKELPSNHLKPFVDGRVWWEDGEGNTPGERTGDAYKKIQTYTPRLIDAMKATLSDIEKTDR